MSKKFTFLEFDKKGNKLIHGLKRSYWYGCRCLECKKANAEYLKTCRNNSPKCLKKIAEDRKKISLYIKDIKVKNGCKVCGYNKHFSALQFHHIDKSLKLFELAGCGTRSIDSINKEIAKCDLLCANCHAEENYRRKDYMSKKKDVCYLSGPMRGYVNFNFEAFDNAKTIGIKKGYKLISPADLDRMDNKSLDNLNDLEKQRIYAKRDCGIIIKSCTHMAMLPGWEKSVGAKAEYCLAIWLGLEVLDARTFEPLNCKYCLTKEEEVVHGGV